MLPPIDINHIAQHLNELGEELQRVSEESSEPIEPTPRALLMGLERLLDVLHDAEGGLPTDFAPRIRRATGSDPELVLEHGLHLIVQLSELAQRLNLPTQAQALEQLTIPLSLWMLRRGCELSYPEPVVNALARLANTLHHPELLVELYGIMSEIMDAIGPERALEREADNPACPWRVLLINRAIVATRTRQPVLMEAAFQTIVEHLPEEAPDFFREGMGQMETLDYPPQAREVMQRYFEIWCSGQRLH
ncbi:MAG: hypothetical protein ACUVQI_06565 [Thermochromatium sp.]